MTDTGKRHTAHIITGIEHFYRLMADIGAALPQIPPSDAPCHAGIVDQEHCANCTRIRKAHEALNIMRNQEVIVED